MGSSRSEGSSSSSARQPYGSPIPYRVGPFEYEPAVLCRCELKAARWISWSVDNPGRRYFKCRNARKGGCDFYAWHDGPTSSFLREVLNDLQGAVHSLRREKADAVKEVEELRVKSEEQCREFASVGRELASVRELVSELDVKNAVLIDSKCRLEKERTVLIWCILSCMCVVILLVLGKN
ncbi:hypothetical protein OsI_14834 [Oryza sativa Indica Group]|uniref:GRF-type domain-containing protein n=2 Tax=Oryza TaxID=4527 RepID=A2WKS6_ORYSI|nr:hypothetical protein OsI_00438 [Oryza sativa Indica Group]EEC76759.1 hypothetical protein OsI_14834 [Oryza sativa Indica Group]